MKSFNDVHRVRGHTLATLDYDLTYQQIVSNAQRLKLISKLPDRKLKTKIDVLKLPE